MTTTRSTSQSASPALIFDLDGTLVDSVYQHVLAWHEALQSVGIDLSVWRIHRRIGMSGGLFLRALAREIGRDLPDETLTRLQTMHQKAFVRQIDSIRPLPGARELLTTLTAARIPWAIATSGTTETAGGTLEMLAVPKGAPVITRDQVAYAKPNPDLFLAAAARLAVDITAAMVVGDSIWDLLAAHRAGTLGVGVLSGGYGREELERAGAYRVYEDPRDLLLHLDELGVREPR